MQSILCHTIILILACVATISVAEEQQNPNAFRPPVYTIFKTQTPIVVDGKFDDPGWSQAPVIKTFHFPWYKSGDKETSKAQMLWDDKYLYIAHTCEDAWITARCKEHDGPVAKDDCFEVMLAPNVNQPDVYFNIEWNVLGAWVDNHRPQGPKKPKAAKWDAKGVKISGRYLGTLNDDNDKDQRWMVEVAIPFTNFRHVAKHTPPQPGEQWNLNLNRHGGDTNLQYSQWSKADTPRPSFHTPHRFGRVTFSADAGPEKQ